MDQFQYKTLLYDTALLSAKAALAASSNVTDFLSKREAYRIYGQSTVNKWIKSGLISASKTGESNSKCRLSRTELEAAEIADFRTQKE